MDLNELLKEKKKQLIWKLCVYFYFAFLVFDKIDYPIQFKILIVVYPLIFIIVDHFTSYRHVKHLIRIQKEMLEEFELQTKSLNHMRDILRTSDIEKLKIIDDSIHLTNECLRSIAKEKNSSGAFKAFEVDPEFDSILFLKRKSTPADEIADILSKGAYL